MGAVGSRLSPTPGIIHAFSHGGGRDTQTGCMQHIHALNMPEGKDQLGELVNGLVREAKGLEFESQKSFFMPGMASPRKFYYCTPLALCSHSEYAQNSPTTCKIIACEGDREGNFLQVG